MRTPQPSDGNPDSADQDPIESLVDPGKLEYLAFRRDVLDWRDGFHAKATLTMSNLYGQFVIRIDKELDSRPIIEKVLPRPAHEVLHGAFIQSIWVPFSSWIKQEESALAYRGEKWGLQEQLDMAFKIKISDAEHYSLGDISFKQANREKIISRLEALMLGSDGIAETYRAQATHLARKLREKRMPC